MNTVKQTLLAALLAAAPAVAQAQNVGATVLGNDGKMQFSKEQMSERKHDPVAVRSVKVFEDRRTVLLDIPDLRPAMQTQLKYDLRTADGKELRGQIIGTIHALKE